MLLLLIQVISLHLQEVSPYHFRHHHILRHRIQKTVLENSLVEHHSALPPDAMRKITYVAPSGQYSLKDTFWSLSFKASKCISPCFRLGLYVLLDLLHQSLLLILVFLLDRERGNKWQKHCLMANTSNMPVAAREASIYTGCRDGRLLASARNGNA